MNLNNVRTYITCDNNINHLPNTNMCSSGTFRSLEMEKVKQILTYFVLYYRIRRQSLPSDTFILHQ